MTFYSWKAKFGGLDVSEARRLEGARGREHKARPAGFRACDPDERRLLNQFKDLRKSRVTTNGIQIRVVYYPPRSAVFNQPRSHDGMDGRTNATNAQAAPYEPKAQEKAAVEA